VLLQPAKSADPVGQTYVLSTFRRSLTRPDSTTLADLAATMRPGPSQQQQHTSQQQHAANATGQDSPLDLWRKIAALRERRLPKRKQLASRASQGQHPIHPMPAQKVHTATAGSSPQGDSAGAKQPRSRVDLSFRGLSAYDARYANSGNQAESGVPDHGLCVGGCSRQQYVETLCSRMHQCLHFWPLWVAVWLSVSCTQGSSVQASAQRDRTVQQCLWHAGRCRNGGRLAPGDGS
jgi:hypothetical protein